MKQQNKKVTLVAVKLPSSLFSSVFYTIINYLNSIYNNIIIHYSIIIPLEKRKYINTITK